MQAVALFEPGAKLLRTMRPHEVLELRANIRERSQTRQVARLDRRR